MVLVCFTSVIGFICGGLLGFGRFQSLLAAMWRLNDRGIFRAKMLPLCGQFSLLNPDRMQGSTPYVWTENINISRES